jgi:hypothetical protein
MFHEEKVESLSTKVEGLQWRRLNPVEPSCGSYFSPIISISTVQQITGTKNHPHTWIPGEEIYCEELKVM